MNWKRWQESLSRLPDPPPLFCKSSTSKQCPLWPREPRGLEEADRENKQEGCFGMSKPSPVSLSLCRQSTHRCSQQNPSSHMSAGACSLEEAGARAQPRRALSRGPRRLSIWTGKRGPCCPKSKMPPFLHEDFRGGGLPGAAATLWGWGWQWAQPCGGPHRTGRIPRDGPPPAG